MVGSKREQVLARSRGRPHLLSPHPRSPPVSSEKNCRRASSFNSVLPASSAEKLVLLSLKGGVYKEMLVHISKTILKRMKLRGNKLITDLCYTCISWWPLASWYPHSTLPWNDPCHGNQPYTVFSPHVRPKLLPWCLTLWDPMDCSPPGCSVLGILQASYWSGLPCPPPGESSWPRDWTTLCCVPSIGRQGFTISTAWEASFLFM